MVLTLAALSLELDSVRDQILTSVVILSLDEVFARLLYVSSPSVVIGFSSSSNLDTSVFASHTQQGDCGSQGNQPRCNYCHRWSHTREKFYKLHGRPP